MLQPILHRFELVVGWHKAVILLVVRVMLSLVGLSSQEPPTEVLRLRLKEWHLQLHKRAEFRQVVVFLLNHKQYLRLALQ